MLTRKYSALLLSIYSFNSQFFVFNIFWCDFAESDILFSKYFYLYEIVYISNNIDLITKNSSELQIACRQRFQSTPLVEYSFAKGKKTKLTVSSTMISRWKIFLHRQWIKWKYLYFAEKSKLYLASMTEKKKCWK